MDFFLKGPRSRAMVRERISTGCKASASDFRLSTGAAGSKPEGGRRRGPPDLGRTRASHWPRGQFL